MKIKILHVVTAVFLVGGALVCNVANAQREGLSPNELDAEHGEYNLNEDKPLLNEHESKAKLVNRDSIGMHSRSSSTGATKVRPSDPNKSVSNREDDEDALSFNFLYYIIQKFKISDLVDE